MKAADGKRRMTDVANTEQLLRIIQSIPSKKAELELVLKLNEGEQSAGEKGWLSADDVEVVLGLG